MAIFEFSRRCACLELPVFTGKYRPGHKVRTLAHFYKDIEITKLDWPSYSPDLNVIELAWNTLKQQVLYFHFG